MIEKPSEEREILEMLDVLKQIQEQVLELLPEPHRTQMRAALEFHATLTPETDRGCGLMAAAFLEERLEQLIRAKLIDDHKVLSEIFEGQGGLATFSSKIDFAYALGLILKNAHRDLHLLRKIRNDFAHVSNALTFETPRISARCQQLYFDGSLRSVHTHSRFTRAMMGLLGVIDIKLHTVVRETAAPDHDIELNRAGVRAFYEELKKRGYTNNPFAGHFPE